MAFETTKGYVIKADTAELADKKAKALLKILNNIETKDLIVLADKVEKNPAIVKTALKYI